MRTYKCPKCGSEDVAAICKVVCHPTENGVENCGAAYKNADDSAYCVSFECDWIGKLSDMPLTKAKELP